MRSEHAKLMQEAVDRGMEINRQRREEKEKAVREAEAEMKAVYEIAFEANVHKVYEAITKAVAEDRDYAFLRSRDVVEDLKPNNDLFQACLRKWGFDAEWADGFRPDEDGGETFYGRGMCIYWKRSMR